jgi:hypothetical protein
VLGARLVGRTGNITGLKVLRQVKDWARANPLLSSYDRTTGGPSMHSRYRGHTSHRGHTRQQGADLVKLLEKALA